MRWILIFLLLVPFVNAQSIGITPRTNELEVYNGEIVNTDFRISQGASYNEAITITPAENYSWVRISESEFTLEPGTRKIIGVEINTQETGRYGAKFEICARGNEAGMLTVTACTDHKLIVNSSVNPVTIATVASATAGGILFVSGLGFAIWRKRLRDRKRY